jgi:hypothetical protein
MTNSYHVYGMNITSDIPLPAALALHLPPDISPDITIEYGDTPAALANPQLKGFRFQAAPGEFLLRVDNIARYYAQNGSRVTITPDNGASEDDILVFLMGSVMGALLHQRNTLVLHAGAIEVNGGSVIFAGPSGVGKSTLTAGFYRRGHPFLADDVCAVTVHDGRPAVIPGFPRLKLWADVLMKLDTGGNDLKSVRWSGNLEKYFLPVENIRQTPVPVHSVFVLETTKTDRMEITNLKWGDKIAHIIYNTYRRRFLQGLGGKTDHFRQCAAVAAKADVYRVTRPRRVFLLNELMDMVEARFLS